MKTDLSREQLMDIANKINESYETEPLKLMAKRIRKLFVMCISEAFLVVGYLLYEIACH